MINEVRQTVLAIANKNNYGYIPPEDFNNYARHAQLDAFKEFFYDYNDQVNRLNKRVAVNQSTAVSASTNEAYGDLAERKRQVIEIVSEIKSLDNIASSGSHVFDRPSDLYLLNKLVYYNTQNASGTQTAFSATPTAPTLTDSGATFTTSVSVGDLVVNTYTSDTAFVTSVTDTVLGLTEDIFKNLGGGLSMTYKIFNPSKYSEIEIQDSSKIWSLDSSNLTKPTTMFPSCLIQGNNVIMYPNSITNKGSVIAQYIREPLDPAWTGFAEGLFNPSEPGYQDFELPESEIPLLVNKILQLAGVSIRDEQIYQYTVGQASIEDTQDK